MKMYLVIVLKKSLADMLLVVTRTAKQPLFEQLFHKNNDTDRRVAFLITLLANFSK